MSEQLDRPVKSQEPVRKFSAGGAVSSFKTVMQRGATLMAIGVGLHACVGSASAERAVKLAWEPSPSASVTRYHVYALEENSSTPVRFDAGNTNVATIPGLKEGLRYSFNVTAVDAQGVESSPSNEAIFVVPVPLEMISASAADQVCRVRFQGVPGRSYELQASADLRTWTKIWQSASVSAYGAMEVADPASAMLGQRFYRLVIR